MKKRFKTFLIVIGIAALVFLAGFLVLKQMGGNPDDIVLGELSLASVEDGVYCGEYATKLVSAKVEVEVSDSEIIEITVLDHECGPGHSAEAITADVVACQSLDVDAISSSTMSSKVILKAVEVALSN